MIISAQLKAMPRSSIASISGMLVEVVRYQFTSSSLSSMSNVKAAVSLRHSLWAVFKFSSIHSILKYYFHFKWYGSYVQYQYSYISEDHLQIQCMLN